ncbi:asparagine synthetase B family protein [Maribacter polysiphoniae]|uniref:Asparagine synthase (Glutamine-hydrolysing) n=1 Tax=Maribacter polysiphoniae TaxID=429344 RepID=A0A316E4L0_9FLAO|nr:asparagine synthase-related protein [Maribacter polysiphoniae]MBD1259024.1 asparagine synthetase B family protein [Maribacter polysiphoniae]PWK24578.1 asparagine synthase (glutamine-hydrolysing) [Maribacter polysiphoniae]
MNSMYVSKVVDLTNHEKNIIYNMSHEEAVEVVKSGDVEAVRKIDGQFSLISVEDKTIRMARSIGRPLRYFIAKKAVGPQLVIAERIDTIYDYLKKEGMDDQFHPSYTRMVPAHYITKIELLGCPDPNPVYTRFFTPERNKYEAGSLEQIGKEYITAVYNEIKKWLQYRAKTGPIGVTFSAGIDSGSIFVLTYHALKELGESPSRLKAFTLSVDGDGADLMQARKFLKTLDLELFLEPIELDYNALDWKEAIRVVEDYKPLDIQSATMSLALLKGIRERYPDWKYIIDGEGGDENLKDYPIEENPELTIRSVLNNLMLYHEGWGVDSIKHSLTYSGGLSRGYMRTFSPADLHDFEGFSPYTLPNVIEISEGIPYIDMTDWDHKKLYDLKGQIVFEGVKAVTGMEMPIFEKRRFQHGVVSKNDFEKHFPEKEIAYRKQFLSKYE